MTEASAPTVPSPSGTPDQLRAITTVGSDLCVVAGAGTGKTHVLTSRIVHRVVRGRLDLRSVLAITFTEKAAAEMKERLASALEKAGRAGARQDVEAAAISTVHAFCARMLRENAVAAGVDPSFKVLDETESDRLLQKALDALVDELRDGAPADFETLAQLGGDDPGETLLDIYRQAQSSGRDVGEFVRSADGLPDVVPLLAAVRAAVGALAPLRATGTPAAQKQVANAIDAAVGLPADDAPPDGLERAVADLRGAFTLQCGGEQKAALAKLRAECDAALPVLAELSLGPIRDVAARAVERLDLLYHEAKGRGERLDFADLERAAVALLRSRDDVRDAVRRRWPEVLVDEFQDTNPVQAGLVRHLRTPDRLFVVGDPKQSIYGFRGADVSVFDDHLAAVAAEGKDGVVALRHSFRARPEVLGAVNRLFEDGLGGTGPGADVKLVAGRTWAPAAQPCVEVQLFGGESLAEARESEARWIARRIGELEGALRVQSPTPSDPLRTRPAAWGDFAVLLRATTNIKVVEQALVERDVPYLVVKGRGFFHAREVVDVTHLLACVDDPRDDLALAAVLRGPACGLTDDALFVLSSSREKDERIADAAEAWAGGRRLLAGLLPEDAAALRRFWDLFSDLRSRRGADGVAALVHRVFARTRLDVMALGRPNGRQRAANLRKVATLAREADADGASLREFVDDLRDLREREVREAEAAVAGGATGAVSLMTVHAAKGLEFPVVFVPDVARSERSDTSRVVSDVRCGVGLKGRAGSPSKTKPWAYARIADRRLAADRAESERLLYVAVTRAADHLVLTGAMGGEGGEADAEDSRRVWWPRIDRAFGVSAGAPGDSDVGPGADEAGATRAVVRVNVRGPVEDDAAPGAGAGDAGSARARNLLGQVASRLAAGTVPAQPLRAEAREDAATLLAEWERVAPPPDGTPYATNVSALTAFERCPQEYRLRHVVGVPEDDDARLFAARTAFDVDDAPPGDASRSGDDDEPDVAPSSRSLGRAAHAALERIVPAFPGAADAGVETAREVEVALRAEAGGGAPDPADVAKLVGWIDRFRASELGREVKDVPRADVRREQAFLLRAGRTVVRGQIDLLWRGAGGWAVLDWKTGAVDRPRREHELQMRLYALGVRAVTGALPSRLFLWSLPAGRAVAVRCDADDARATESLLAEFAARAASRDWASVVPSPCGDCRVRAACRFAAPESDGTLR